MLMDLGIAGKVAIVTGGSHGIGRAVSEELGRNGCRVVVVARGQEQLDSTVDAIGSEGGEAIAVSADITAFDCFPRMVDETRSYGRCVGTGLGTMRDNRCRQVTI